MPLFDVHLRMPVRFKFRNVEARTAEEAVRTAMKDQARMELAARNVQREYDTGLIENIELDEADVLNALVDLVGDEQYLHTVDFDFDPAGEPVPHVPDRTVPTTRIGAIAHAAAGTKPASDGVEQDAVGRIVDVVFGSAPEAERTHAIADMDAVIAALIRARDAVTQQQTRGAA